jgi:hypothetical protein
VVSLRRSYIRRKSPRRISKQTPEEKAYQEWIHEQECVGVRSFSTVEYGRRQTSHVCQGRIEQSHDRNMTGMGLKAPERDSVPMCSELHRQWTDHSGLFSQWEKPYRRLWMRERIREANDAFDAGHPREATA